MSEIPPPAADFAVTREIWPEDLPRTLEFHHGRRPLHEYVRVHAQERPGDPALSYYGRTLTWRALDDRVDDAASALLSAGHDPGDVCALFLQNCPQFHIAYFGAQRAGLAVTPVNPQVAEPAARRQLDDSDAAVLVTHTDLLEVARPAADAAGVDDRLVTAYGDFAGDAGPVPVHPVVADETPVDRAVEPDRTGERSFVDALEAAAGATDDLPDVALSDTALLQYTGGTTGLPKGCVHTHWNLLFKATATARIRKLAAADVSLGAMPTFHVAGKQRYCDALAVAGHHVVLLPRYTPEAVMAAVDAHEVTSTWLAVPVIQEIVDHPDVDEYDLRSLSSRRPATNCSSFGATLTRELSDAWEALTGAIVQESGYGLTETHTSDTHTWGADRIEPGFVGQPTYGVEIEVRDPDTNEPLSPGEQGEIVLRTPATMTEYLDDPAATAAVLEDDGFLHTGDVGRLTEAGYLYFLGRRKDSLKVSGHTVSPREIEVVLADHEYVDDVIVVGAPHDSRGSVPEAHLIPADDAPADEAVLAEAVQTHAAASLAEFKRPQSIVVRESVPRTDVGKVDRATFRERLPDEYE